MKKHRNNTGIQSFLTSALVLLFLLAGRGTPAHAQATPTSLQWEWNSTSSQTVYVASHDSLGYSINAAACTHFNITDNHTNYTLSISPTTVNSTGTAVVQTLYVTLDDYGGSTAVTLTHKACPYSISVSPTSLEWDWDGTGGKSVTVTAGYAWSASLSGSGASAFSLSASSGSAGTSTVTVTPAGENTGSASLGAVLTFTCGTKTASVNLSQGTDPMLSGLSSGTNYIQKVTFTSADGSAYTRDVTYYDGLGYAEQTLNIAGSPSGKTVAVQTVWDAMRRPDATVYLPYVRGDGGAYNLDSGHSLEDVGYWYQYGTNGYDDSRPYAVKTYEGSQYGRPTYMQREGDAWNADGGHGTTISYGFNGDTQGEPAVLRFRWHPADSTHAAPYVTGGGDWPDGALARTRTTDEAGAVSDSYSTAGGLTVCTRSWSGTNGAGTSGTMAETYYVYDYRDSLALVVQPEGAAALKALPAESRLMTIEDNAANANNTIYKEYCFGYIYDGWGNLIREHVPGGGTVERTYDARDRLVLETNDLMAPRAIQTVYDNFDRVVQRRIVDANLSQVCPLYSAEYHPFGRVSGALTGFIADADVAEAAEVETENIKGMLKSETLYPAANADGTAPAGGITRTKNYWYDYRGRIIQIQESDSDGWTARYSTKYDFCGNVLATKETHTSPLNETHCLRIWNEYDTRGRLTASGRELDGDCLRPVYYNYDELGRLSRKEIGDDSDNIGNIAFDYDIHGWTTCIEARINWGQDLVFRETLRYASPQKPGTTARYNGNISEITFTSYNGTPTPASDTYGYEYDGLKRLTDAAHYAGSATTQSLLKTEKNITYDRDGNITGLDRYGAAGLSEMLSFTHAGNRLSSVQSWDGANLPQIGTFTYDAMGNQLTDGKKGLQFCYNFANLPSKVEGSAGSGNAGLTLSYGYLSDGTKTSAITETAAGSGAEGLKYRGSFVYETVPVPGSEDGEEFLSGIGWSEGRIAFDNPFEVAADSAAVEAVSLPEGLTALVLAHGGVEEPGDTTETAASLLGTMHDLWYIADHLGNTRAVVDMTFGGFVAESNECLPFGTRLDGTLALPENRYRLAGKEEQRFGGLDLAMSDFGARFYDPFTCRWTTRDPLAGKYHSLSPYNYCAGNPVNLVDPDGNILDTFLDAASLAMGVKSFVSNVKQGKVGAAIVDGLGIVADAAALATPFASAGAGMAIKAVRGVDKVADTAKAAKAADNVADAANGVSHVSEMRRGVANEAKTLEKLGETKNTKSLTGHLKDGSERTTIPDINNSTTIGEIKDTKAVYNTKQIQAERDVAHQAGKEFKIYTGTNTHVSSNIPESEIVRLPWLGPQ